MLIAMGKRILLFVATNIAIVFMLTIVLQILGISGNVRIGGRLDLGALMTFSLIWGMGGAVISLLMSRFIAKMSMGVKVVDGSTGSPDVDWLYRTVQRLASQAQLPMPEVGVYESPEVNAFATGPSKSRSLVAVSSGLLRSMRQDEIEGVLAHELAHIKNGDMVTMTLIQGVINAFVIFLARLIGSLVRGSDSRNGQGLSFIVTLGAADRARDFRVDDRQLVLAGP